MKRILFMLLFVFLTIVPNIEGKNDKSTKGEEKKEWTQEKKDMKMEDKEDMGRSEDAKKNWGQMKGEYDTDQERIEAKSMIQHKKRLRNVLYNLNLDYNIDTEEEYNYFLELFYSEELDLSDEDKAKIEEEINKFQKEYIEEEEEEVEENQE